MNGHSAYSDSARSRTANEQVLASLPADAEIGTYYWWAKLARQNTGTSILDSGSAYGRTFEQPVPPDAERITIDVGAFGKFDTVRINTIWWLTDGFEADDEVAQAIQECFDWFTGHFGKSDPWLTSIGDFCDTMPKLLDGNPDWLDDDAQVVIDRLVVAQLLSEEYDAESLEECMGDVPYVAFTRVHREHLNWKQHPSEYTYNFENDLTQDVQYTLLVNDGYVFMQTHNGCDARGGISSPVVAAVRDGAYSFPRYQCEYYCGTCEYTGYDAYHHDEEYDKFHQTHGITAADIEKWQAMLAHQAAKDAGQLAMPGLEFEWPEDWHSEEVACALVNQWKDILEIDADPVAIDYPEVLVKDGNTWRVTGDEQTIRVATENALLLCPDCGMYGMYVGAE